MSEDGHTHNSLGIICGHAMRRERPVNYIRHCPDGTFDFMCGEWDHDNIDDAFSICTGCAMDKISGELQLADIPKAAYAERPNKDARWVIHKMSEDDIAEYEGEA